jgi:hypothetical protein
LATADKTAGSSSPDQIVGFQLLLNLSVSHDIQFFELVYSFVVQSIGFFKKSNRSLNHCPGTEPILRFR